MDRQTAVKWIRPVSALGALVLLGGLSTACAKPERPMRLDASDGACTRRADTPPVAGPCWLRLVSYNVRGLSPLLIGAPTKGDEHNRNSSIGWLARDYDLLLLQEDFEYTKQITGGPEFSFVERGNSPRWSWAITPLRILTAPIRWLQIPFNAPYGAGVTIAGPDLYPLKRNDEGKVVPNGDGVIVRKAFEHCAGWLDKGSDCLSTKGLLGMRFLLRNGAEIDVYTTHLDSGDGPEDRLARKKQLREIKRIIRKKSGLPGDAGHRAIIFAGDLNADRSDPEEVAQLKRELLDPLGLEDTRVIARDGFFGTKVDYLLYRDGATVDLEVQAEFSGEDLRFRHPRNRANEAKTNHYRNILSDHPALGACLIVTRKGDDLSDPVMEMARGTMGPDPTRMCRPNGASN